MNVMRPGMLVGLSRSASAIASAAVDVGPNLMPNGLWIVDMNSTCAPSSWRVRSPIHKKWAEQS
jgi:hypothetical protein